MLAILVKCYECLQRGDKKEMIRNNNKKYYHIGECHEKHLKEQEFKKSFKIKQIQLLNLIVKIHNLSSVKMIPAFFHKRLNESIAGIDNILECFDLLISSYEGKIESINWCKQNKKFSSIQDELIYCFNMVMCDVQNKIEGYNKQAETADMKLNEDQTKELSGYIVESPIEMELIKALIYYRNTNITYTMKTQKPAEVNGRKYRVDLLLIYKNKFNKNNSYIIIEADGHDFHERTKDQAERDRQRDRDFLSVGAPTIRFTGREIKDNPKKCVDEIHNIISKICISV